MLFIGLHKKNYPERLISGIDILFGLFEALSIEQEFSKTNNKQTLSTKCKARNFNSEYKTALYIERDNKMEINLKKKHYTLTKQEKISVTNSSA